MLVVKIEVWPFGSEEQRRDIAQMVIVNDGTGDLEWGNYDIWVPDPLDHPNDVTTTMPDGRIEDHERIAPVWDLVERALVEGGVT